MILDWRTKLLVAPPLAPTTQHRRAKESSSPVSLGEGDECKQTLPLL
jgi:hypothetical protein